MQRRFTSALVFLLKMSVICAALASHANASPPLRPATTAPVTSTQTTSEQLDIERAGIAAQLAAAKTALAEAQASQSASVATLGKEVDALLRMDLLLGQILATAAQGSELQASKAALDSDLKQLRISGPPEQRPFRFATLEALKDQLREEESRSEALADAASAAQEALAAAKRASEQKASARRAAAAAAGEGGSPTDARLADLESQAAALQARLRERELANVRAEVEIHDLRLRTLHEKIELVAQETQFTKQDLDAILDRLDSEEASLTQALDLAQSLLTARDAAWSAARERLEAAAEKDPSLVAEVAAKRTARQAKQRDVTMLGKNLQQVAEDRTVWTRRFEAFNQTADAEALRAWDKETTDSLAQIERDIRRLDAELRDRRNEIAALDASFATAATDPAVQRWLEEQRRSAQEVARLLETGLSRLDGAKHIRVGLAADIDAQMATVAWSERLRGFWTATVRLWNYEITSIDDNPITISKVAIGLLLLVGGILLSRWLVRVLGSRLLPRFGFNEGAAAIVQSLLFYLLVFTVAMLSLRIVNVPLTAFTILGGALAIGIGFGSQNVMNNFISGLILLAERPIRVGDLIQIEDLIGTVEHIGPRSTRVRSPENVDIVVPNSTFVEKNVVNWTLSDDRYRAKLVVGVAYGSPTRDVTRMLRRAVTEHGRVLEKPEPIVLFADFGDSALIFEVHFWVRMRRMMERRIIESDLRHRIDGLFHEAGIVIAFPQRDVHLNTIGPLEVRLAPGADNDTESNTRESTAAPSA